MGLTGRGYLSMMSMWDLVEGFLFSSFFWFCAKQVLIGTIRVTMLSVAPESEG
jgi:hypothetical protein